MIIINKRNQKSSVTQRLKHLFRCVFAIISMTMMSSSYGFTENSPNIQPDVLKNSKQFTTWIGIEPDKWATVWLIKRYISRDAYFVLTPVNAKPDTDAIVFGTPQASIHRNNKQSMFHNLRVAMQLNQPELLQIDAIIKDIEVNIWEPPKHPYTQWVEILYRQLQARYNREQVPVDCYLSFFDNVSKLVTQTDLKADNFEQKLNLKQQCPGLNTENPSANQPYIPQIDHLALLREFSLGKNIVFIDTREDEEYTEVHLPDAKLLRLREVNANTVKPFQNADLVVPYCVKDFRGFEVGRAMKEHGIQNVATLSPNGLKGWLKTGLPVTQNGQTNEQPAIEQLMRCAMEPSSCLGKKH